MRSRLPHIIAAVIVSLLTAAAAYSAYWFSAAAGLQSGIDGWAAARRAEGYTVAYESVEIAGYPWRLTVALGAPMVARPGADPAWLWRADRISAMARPWNLAHIAVDLPASNHMTYQATGAAEQRVTVTLDRGIARLGFAAAGLETAVIEIAGLAAGTADGPIAIAALDASAQRIDAATTALALDARGIVLPPGAESPLGRDVDRLAIEAVVAGKFPDGPSRLALTSWSEAGGVVEIEDLRIAWGDLGLVANGTMALDDRLRPQAALTARITGYGRVIDAFAAAGAMKPSEASLAKSFLNLMAKRNAAGVRVLKVPLSAQGGTLYVGPVPLIKLAPVIPGL